MRKILTLLLIATMALMLFTACEGLTVSAEENYIALDFEEAGVQFVVDSNDEVVSYSASNYQGEELLIEEDFNGKDVYLSIEILILSAIELGYIDVDTDKNNPNAVLVTVEQFRNRSNNKYKEQVKNRVEFIVASKGVWAIILEAEDIKELKDIGKEYGISTAKARMVIAAQYMGIDISYESIQNSSPQEIAQLFKDKRPIIAEINKLESDILELKDELERVREEISKIDKSHGEMETLIEIEIEILIEIENLESQIEALTKIYEEILSQREQNRIHHQERVEAHMAEIQEKVNTIRQSKERHRRFSEEIVDSKIAKWNEMLK